MTARALERRRTGFGSWTANRKKAIGRIHHATLWQLRKRPDNQMQQTMHCAKGKKKKPRDKEGNQTELSGDLVGDEDPHSAKRQRSITIRKLVGKEKKKYKKTVRPMSKKSKTEGWERDRGPRLAPVQTVRKKGVRKAARQVSRTGAAPTTFRKKRTGRSGQQPP